MCKYEFYDHPFIDYCKKEKIGQVGQVGLVGNGNNDMMSTYYFSCIEIAKLMDRDLVLNGKGGGLVLGGSHMDEDILLVTYNTKSDCFYVKSRIQGWEYINDITLVAEFLIKKLEEINKSRSYLEEESLFGFEIPTNTPILDTRTTMIPQKIIIANGNHHIVNHVATKYNIDQLNLINSTIGKMF